jgi:hypothetical protein
MENQPIMIEGMKPLAMSAMKRDGLPNDIEKLGEEVPVKIEGQAEEVLEKEIR